MRKRKKDERVSKKNNKIKRKFKLIPFFFVIKLKILFKKINEMFD